MDLSVVIPVYGSEKMLRELSERLLRVLNDTGLEYEVIFVNDDSPDDAWTVLSELHAADPSIISAIRLTRNFGQHNAIMCGFRHTRGRYVVTMDDDLQHPPEEIPKLIKAIEDGNLDVVYGRYEGKKHAPWRNVGSKILNIVYRRVFEVSTEFTAFRIIRREIVESAIRYDLNFTFIDGLLAWSTTKIGGAYVEHAARADGRSGYSIGKLVLLSLNLLTNFSLLPLQVATLLGLISAAGGLGVGLFYIGRSLLGEILVPGYASAITATLFLGGVQLLAIGIIGEYVGRLHLNINRKPQYRERQTLSANSDVID